MARHARWAHLVTVAMTGVAEIQELVLDAVAGHTPLRIAGRSHWMDAGRPVTATRIATLAAYSGIVEYVPGDLTITVRGGTTLREIESITRARGQWLPLDPFGTRDGTIGATIATGSFGPLAHGFGRVRDLVLGLEFVTGEGKVVRGGGKVVKNVAGFDLVRLVTGSWGTLGLITEATLRLYSLAEQPTTISFGAPDSPTALAQRISSILATPGLAYAVELIDGRTAGKIGLAQKQQILVKLGGNRAAVAAQRTAMESLGGLREVDAESWNRLRVIEDSIALNAARRDSPIVARISGLPTQIASIWAAAGEATADVDGAIMHSTPSLGVVRCMLPAGAPMQSVERLLASAPNATVIFERLPAAAWPVTSPSVVTDRLSQGIKSAFDPSNILNPGIMGNGA